MRRLVVLTANHRYVWRLQLKSYVLSQVTFAHFDRVTGSLEAWPVPGQLFMTVLLLYLNLKRAIIIILKCWAGEKL